MNVHVHSDVVKVEDVDFGVDGGVNGDVDVNVDANFDVDVCVVMCSGWRWSWRCGLDGDANADWPLGRALAQAQGSGAVHSKARALLHTHCCAEPCSGGDQRIEQ